MVLVAPIDQTTSAKDDIVSKKTAGWKLPRTSNPYSPSPFFVDDIQVFQVEERLANSPYSIDRVSHSHSKKVAYCGDFDSRGEREEYLLRSTTDFIYSSPRYLDSWRPLCCQKCSTQVQASDGRLTTRKVFAIFAFSHCGLDFYGRFYNKDALHQVEKLYVTILYLLRL